MKYIFTLVIFIFSVQAAERPNIVWVVSEDNSANWLKIYNEDGVKMPTIESLAANGLVFNNAFSCAPVCSVARSTIISGCYAPRLGTQYHRRQGKALMPKGLRLFPYYLRQAGYYTTNNSKQDYNFASKEKQDVWDESSNDATYKKRKSGQPFFHVQNFFTTHESSVQFSDMEKSTSEDPSKIKVAQYHPDTEIFRYTYAYYRDRHRQLDKKIGDFLKNLKKDGLMDDTFVFYYGDHGGVLPRGKGYAYNNGLQIPMVVHVPKKWQHLVPAKRGSRIDGFVQFVDLGPTVLNLAGVDIPEGLDGKPFLGKNVEIEELNSRSVSFGYADRFDEKYDLVRSVRKGKYHYMRNYQRFNFDSLYNRYRYRQLAYKEWLKLYKEGKLNEVQSQFFEIRSNELLFDLEKDQDEVKNLANDPAYATIIQEMRELLKKQVMSQPDLSFIPEPVMIKEGKGDFVGYSQKNKQKIQKLIEVADLSLKSFSDAEAGITQALSSKVALERYWGLIVCSNFGAEAKPFFDLAKQLAANDPNALVRTRAAEFLGLNAVADPVPVLMDVLAKTGDGNVQGLVLNTIALLQDGKNSYKFDFKPLFDSGKWADFKLTDPTKRRLQYLANLDTVTKKGKKNKK